MAKQIFPRHRVQPVMLPVISPEEYMRQASVTPVERQMLNDNELTRAKSFPSEKRQKEWLTARICAKIAALQYHSSITNNLTSLRSREITITNNPEGRPSLSGSLTPELRNTDISLSHGAGFGLALVADCRCGVDLQEPRGSIIKVREKFCTTEEEEVLINALGELPERQYLTLLWTAKEAAKKSLSHERMPGFMELILTSLEPHAAGWAIHFLVSSRFHKEYPQTITAIAELYEAYSLALCLSGETINA